LIARVLSAYAAALNRELCLKTGELASSVGQHANFSAQARGLGPEGVALLPFLARGGIPTGLRLSGAHTILRVSPHPLRSRRIVCAHRLRHLPFPKRGGAHAIASAHATLGAAWLGCMGRLAATVLLLQTLWMTEMGYEALPLMVVEQTQA
jgi:hypothetical protein